MTQPALVHHRPRYASPDREAFARYLQQHREQNGLSLRDLGVKLGLSHTCIKHAESGTRPPLLPNYWDALLEALPTMTHSDLRRAYILSVIGRLCLPPQDVLTVLKALLPELKPVEVSLST